MTINVNNPEADALTRKFAKLAGVGITDAIVIAMREAIERRRSAETPLQTAARLRAKYGVTLTERAMEPLPKAVFDEMWGDTGAGGGNPADFRGRDLRQKRQRFRLVEQNRDDR